MLRVTPAWRLTRAATVDSTRPLPSCILQLVGGVGGGRPAPPPPPWERRLCACVLALHFSYRQAPHVRGQVSVRSVKIVFGEVKSSGIRTAWTSSSWRVSWRGHRRDRPGGGRRAGGFGAGGQAGRIRLRESVCMGSKSWAALTAADAGFNPHPHLSSPPLSSLRDRTPIAVVRTPAAAGKHEHRTDAPVAALRPVSNNVTPAACGLARVETTRLRRRCFVGGGWGWVVARCLLWGGTWGCGSQRCCFGGWWWV